MIVRCWGARGSISVSGPEYVRYGGDTTCLELRTRDDSIIVIDAGSGIRRLGNSMLRQGRLDCSMIFTHAHWDHLIGFPFFKPVHESGARLTVYGCPLEQGNMRLLLAHTMAAPYFPVPYDAVRAAIEYKEACSVDEVLSIDGLRVSSIPLSHPNLGLGYKFRENGKIFVFLTDNELAHRHSGGRNFDDYAEFVRNADLLIHDAEYSDKEYEKTKGWGHSTYMDALRLALAAGVRRFGLFHHNQDRTDEEMDAIVEECRAEIKKAGSDMECFGVSRNLEIEL